MPARTGGEVFGVFQSSFSADMSRTRPSPERLAKTAWCNFRVNCSASAVALSGLRYSLSYQLSRQLPESSDQLRPSAVLSRVVAA